MEFTVNFIVSFLYIHALREIAAHLTRCALHNTSQLSNLMTLKAIIKQATLYHTYHLDGKHHN